MGNGMNKIITGVYVGNFRDAKDLQQLSDHNITHVLAIHDNAKQLHQDKEYLCISASDNTEQNLKQFFPQCNDFIHQARINNGNVLIHCLAGVSRSVTVTTAYIMSVTSLQWRDALNSVRGARRCANPNFGFQRQLQDFEHDGLEQERQRMQEKYSMCPAGDEDECKKLLAVHQRWVLHGDELDDGLYPLPHNAYTESVASKQEKNATAPSMAPFGVSIETKVVEENQTENASADAEWKECTAATSVTLAQRKTADEELDSLFNSVTR